MRARLVNPDRKGQPVFVNEGFEGNGGHRGMMFKYCVKPNDAEIVASEHAVQFLGLWRAMGDTA